jgi:hypothetical protein
MLVELGNHARLHAIDDRPAVTYYNVPDSYAHDEGLDGNEFRDRLARSLLLNKPVKAGDAEALYSVVNAWPSHASDSPAWVWSDNAQMAQNLSDFYEGLTIGRPDGFEDLYWRNNGAQSLPPGVSAAAVPDLSALLTNNGRVIWANALGGGALGTAGTATSTTSSTLVSGTITSVSANQFAGYRIYAGNVWGNIISHTSGTTPTFTIDQWYAVPDTGSAGSTPSGTSLYVIASGGSVAAWYVGITSTSITPAATDTSLSGEQTANGLARKIATFTLTSGTSPATYTLTPTFTYTGATSVTIYALGAFVSAVKSDTTDTMVFETSLNASATVNSNGDSIAITETVTGS